MSKSKEIIVSLIIILWSTLESWTAPFRKDTKQLEYLQRKATRMIRVLEIKPYAERMRALGVFNLEKTSMIATLKHHHMEVG